MNMRIIIVQVTILFGWNDAALSFNSYTNISNTRFKWRYSYHDGYDPTRKNLLHQKRTVLAAASAVTDTVLSVVHSYQSSVENAGLLTDIFTCSCINTMSDSTAQFLSFGKQEEETIVEKNNQDDQENNISIFSQSNTKSKEANDFASLAFTPSFAASTILSDVPRYDVPRTARLSLFGLTDGALTHIWFIALDSVVGEGQGLVETLIKTAADALVYTPLWCFYFLAFMTCFGPISSSSLEQHEIFVNESDDTFRNRIQLIPSIWKSDWLELFQGNVGFFLPLTGLVYGFVPREERVLAFGIASFVYTTILSLWNKNRQATTGEPS